VTDSSFEAEVLQATIPVLVDFWAEWCLPCRMISPALDEIAESYGEKLKVAKMNVDQNRVIPFKYGIRSIPSLLIFKGGELKDTLVGALPKNKIMEMIAKHL
jgi:thioredoxin 1